MTELERWLFALGRELDYPPEPDIAAAVHERLASEPRGIGGDSPIDSARRGQVATRRESRRALRMIAIACLVLLALAATALAVSPAARDALRDLFDIGGVTIETTTAPAPEPARRSTDLGERTALGAARPGSGSARWCRPPWAIPTPRSPTPRCRRWPSSTGPGRACPPPRPRRRFAGHRAPGPDRG